MTLIGGYRNTNGLVEMNGTYGSICARFDHNHIESAYSARSSYGLPSAWVDHNRIQDANGVLLNSPNVSSFYNGEYLMWQVSGHVHCDRDQYERQR